MTLLIDYLGYAAVKIASFIFRLLPISLGLWLARRIGQILYCPNTRRRLIAYQNLKAAMGSSMSPHELRKTLRRTYENLLQNLVEVLTFPRINEKYVNKYIKFDKLENLEEAKRQGKGIIFLTGHFGNWELSSVAGGLKGHPMLVLAREQKHSRLNDLLNQYRELTGCKVIKKGFAIKDMITALKNNEIIGMLVDQDAGKRGVFVDFFGRKTSSAHGPMKFALRTGATILPTFIVREKGAYHRVVTEKPLYIKKTDDIESDIKNGLQQFVDIFESYIKQYPDQWLWVHKRWKSTPTRKILVLDDGKAGHLNQSLAVADLIKRYRMDEGYKNEDTRCKVVSVAFKNKASRFFLNICNRISCLRPLKISLKDTSYKAIVKEYADIVISCGASSEAVNLSISKEMGAKNIIIMKPSVAGTKRFKLVIAPKHDKLTPKSNIVITQGAPNRISDERLKKDAALLRERFGFEKKTKIGLLIGGDNPEFKLTPELTHKLIDSAIEIACQIDAEILVTTSRRTSSEVSEILKERLGKHLRCKLLVIANEKNIDEAVSGILGLSQIVMVSGESISMISEAKAASNYLFVFRLDRKKSGILKHELFLNNMKEEGLIELVNVSELFDRVTGCWNKKPAIKKIDDTFKIYYALKKVVQI